MVVKDKYADEPTVEINAELWRRYEEAKTNAKAWEEQAEYYQRAIATQMGDATAATVNGVKVISHRPVDKYATERLIKEHPALTQHYMREETVSTFDLRLFCEAFPDLAEQYRTRRFSRLDIPTQRSGS